MTRRGLSKKLSLKVKTDKEKTILKNRRKGSRRREQQVLIKWRVCHGHKLGECEGQRGGWQSWSRGNFAKITCSYEILHRV